MIARTANHSIQRTGVSRLAQSAFVTHRRLAPAADAEDWAASDASCLRGGRVHYYTTLGMCGC